MSMRTKATFILVSIVLAITATSIITNYLFSRRSITDAVEQDLSLAINFADKLVSAKMKLIKANGATVAERLLRAGSPEEMAEIMSVEIDKFPEFNAFSVFDQNLGVIANYGAPVKSAELLEESRYVQMAYNGESVIPTTHYNSETNDFVMHVFVPMTSKMAMVAAISGFTFSDLIRNYRVWKTGSILILDQEGTIIADRIEESVLRRLNPILEAKTNPDNKEMLSRGEMAAEILSTETGTGSFLKSGIEYICKYKRITGTTGGWHVLVMAPTKENPGAQVQWDLIFSALFFLGIGILISILVSPFVVRPYKKIEKQANEILEAHNRTNLLLNAMPFACHLWDSNYEMIFCNDQNKRLFNLENSQEFLNNHIEYSPMYQTDGQPSSVKQKSYLKKSFEEGLSVFEWMHQQKDGTKIPTEVTFVRVPFDNVNVVAGYVRDLREQKKMINQIEQRDRLLEDALEETRNANNAKSEFLARMSHEMRTPLNAIIGLSRLCLETNGANEEIYNNLEKVYEAGEILLSTVNDILDISKIEAGRLELIPGEYSIPSLINDTVTQNILRIGEKPIKFILDIEPSLPTLLYGDELRIKQLFNNLLSNAFKYTREGKVELTVRCEQTPETKDVWMTIRVEDSGIGIRSEKIDNLFSDYSQMDISANRKIEGTGLGLSITKKIAEMMDGSVTVESEYGKGSVFTAKIKQKFVNDSVIGEEVVKNLKKYKYSDQQRRKKSRLERKQMPYARVLVVDDMQTNLDVAKGMLGKYGMHIDCITSGQKAINVIRSGKPQYDAVFMDHMMPEMDGIEAVRIIREEVGTEYARTLPIIALTANAIVGNEEMFLQKGFQAFISKPIDVIELDKILNIWIRNSIFQDFEIEGVDFAKGLERYSTEENYLNLIRSFCLHTPDILKKIRTLNPVYGESPLFEETTGISLSEYMVLVHGIKGSCYSISANLAGIEAEKLEKAARKGDIGTVIKGNGTFIKMMESLLSDLDGLLQQIAFSEEKPRKNAPDTTLLSQLLENAKEYRAATMEQIIKQLESFDYESGGDLVAWIRSQMNNLEYDAICERLVTAV
ncbi:MAG: ATP-binding protein [Treponema sp.]|nr:ATP-binding protein [Treponema sp.]